MTIDTAVRWCEIGLAGAAIQQSLEHLVGGVRRSVAHGEGHGLGASLILLTGPMYLPAIFLPRVIAAGLLVAGVAPAVALAGLLVTGLLGLLRFDGPYNGGSDRLGLLANVALLVSRVWPVVAPIATGYLAVQVIASYSLAGWAKIANPDWRNGRVLADLFQFSAYPVAEPLRALGQHSGLLPALAWGVMLLEIGFPLALVDQTLLRVVLTLTGLFHLSAAVVLGLNRFLWVWLATYPALIWLQAQL